MLKGGGRWQIIFGLIIWVDKTKKGRRFYTYALFGMLWIKQQAKKKAAGIWKRCGL
ncbi:MAG: hypothetical protein GY943_05510 [Chloroflexi bacterium]|nr:hypothetical protein [Chloroflexota bacterium]